MSDSLDNARKFLERLQRADLAKLLAHSEVSTGVGGAEDRFNTYVIVRSPRPFAEAIATLPLHDRKRIAEAVISDEGGTVAPSDITGITLSGPPIEGLPALLPDLIIHQQMMIDVGTGKASIQDVNDFKIALGLQSQTSVRQAARLLNRLRLFERTPHVLDCSAVVASLAGRLGENHSILQICNKTKCVKLVSNVADAIKNQMANGGGE